LHFDTPNRAPRFTSAGHVRCLDLGLQQGGVDVVTAAVNGATQLQRRRGIGDDQLGKVCRVTTSAEPRQEEIKAWRDNFNTLQPQSGDASECAQQRQLIAIDADQLMSTTADT